MPTSFDQLQIENKLCVAFVFEETSCLIWLSLKSLDHRVVNTFTTFPLISRQSKDD